MVKKYWLVAVVIVAVCANYVFIFAMMPFFRQMVTLGSVGAENDSFAAFRYALQSSPLWFFLGAPFLCGVVLIVLILRQKENYR